MDTRTGEVRDYGALTEAEKNERRSDGALAWVKIPKGYVPKVPATDEDIAHVIRAQEKRERRKARRRAAQAVKALNARRS